MAESKNYQEIYDQLKTEKGTGRHVRSFSLTDFNKLLTSFLNTPEYKMRVAKYKNGILEVEDLEVVKEFREGLGRCLINHGFDKQEVENYVANAKFRASDVRGFYPLISEIVMNYVSLGKKFDFCTRENVKASIYLKHVPASVNQYKAPKTQKVGEVTKQEHYKLVSKSRTPQWLKKLKNIEL